MAKWWGLNPPFLGGSQNVLSKQMDERLIKNDIKQLLLTVPGERVYRPDFGTQLRAFPFELIGDQQQMQLLQYDIEQQLARFEERVVVNRVDVLPSEDLHTLLVSVSVSPVDQPLVNYLVEAGITNSGAING